MGFVGGGVMPPTFFSIQLSWIVKRGEGRANECAQREGACSLPSFFQIWCAWLTLGTMFTRVAVSKRTFDRGELTTKRVHSDGLLVTLRNPWVGRPITCVTRGCLSPTHLLQSPRARGDCEEGEDVDTLERRSPKCSRPSLFPTRCA